MRNIFDMTNYYYMMNYVLILNRNAVIPIFYEWIPRIIIAHLTFELYNVTYTFNLSVFRGSVQMNSRTF